MLLMKDLYSLAGLLEGEGSFGVGRSLKKVKAGESKYLSIQVCVMMTDKDVVERVSSIFGGHALTHYNRREDKGLDVWRVGVAGWVAAQWMMTLYSLMGERRRGQVRDSLSLWRKHRQYFRRDKNGPCRRGHWDRWVYMTGGTPGKGKKYLACLECRKEDQQRRTERRRWTKGYQARLFK